MIPAELEHVMAGELLDDERLRLLIQVRSMGLVEAMSFFSANGSIDRCPSDRHRVGYAGLGAQVHASGTRYTEEAKAGGWTHQTRVGVGFTRTASRGR